MTDSEYHTFETTTSPPDLSPGRWVTFARNFYDGAALAAGRGLVSPHDERTLRRWFQRLSNQRRALDLARAQLPPDVDPTAPGQDITLAYLMRGLLAVIATEPTP